MTLYGSAKLEYKPSIINKDMYRIGVSDSSEWWPYFLMGNKDLLRYVGDVFIYHCEDHRVSRNTLSKGYYRFFYYLMNPWGNSSGLFTFVHLGTPHKLIVLRGCVMDLEGKILLMMTFNDPELLLPIESEITERFERFKLFLSSDLYQEEKYKSFMRRLTKEYIESCYNMGVSVEILPSHRIERTVFSSGIKLEFDSLTQMQEHLSKDVGTLLRKSFKKDRVEVEQGTPVTEGAQADRAIATLSQALASIAEPETSREQNLEYSDSPQYDEPGEEEGDSGDVVAFEGPPTSSHALRDQYPVTPRDIFELVDDTTGE